LQDQGGQRPVGGQVTEGPSQGDHGDDQGADEPEDADPRQGVGWSAVRSSRRWARATAAPVMATTVHTSGWGWKVHGPDVVATVGLTVGIRPPGRRLAGMASPDRLERVTDLLLVLLDTGRPLSLREIALRVRGTPTDTTPAARPSSATSASCVTRASR